MASPGSSSTSPRTRCGLPAPRSRSSSSGSCRSPRSWGPLRTSPCRSPTRPSARSPGSKRARRSARSTAICSSVRRSRCMGERDSGLWVPPGGSADPGPQAVPEPPPAPEPPLEMPSPEELAEQLRRLKASDVVLSLIPTLAQVAWAKLDPELRDLTEARVAIDAIRALVPVLDGVAPPEVTRDLQQLVTNLQLAYASAADDRAGDASRTPEPG